MKVMDDNVSSREKITPHGGRGTWHNTPIADNIYIRQIRTLRQGGPYSSVIQYFLKILSIKRGAINSDNCKWWCNLSNSGEGGVLKNLLIVTFFLFNSKVRRFHLV